MKLGSGFSFLSVALCDRPPTLLTLCCPDLQDGSPAGTIFAEDIEDVKEDYEESQKDSSKVFLTPSSHTVTTPEHFTHTHTHTLTNTLNCFLTAHTTHCQHTFHSFTQSAVRFCVQDIDKGTRLHLQCCQQCQEGTNLVLYPVL